MTDDVIEPTDKMIDAGMRAFGETELVGSHYTRRALVAAYKAMREVEHLSGEKPNVSGR